MSNTCYHCNAEMTAAEAVYADVGGRQQALCCNGCLAAVQFIHDLNLDAFYRFREQCQVEGSASHQQQSLSAAALAPATEQLDETRCRVSLLIPDVRCAACIWLMEKAVSQMPGVHSISASFATQRLQVEFDASTSAQAIAERVHRLGYEVRPDMPDAAREAYQQTRRSMLMRLGIAGIGMMQVMMFALAAYVAGPGGMEPAYESLLRWASLALTTPVVFYSAMLFHVNAWHAIRNRSLVMDVPVSIAILAAWSLSTWNTMTHGAEVYFDTATMFTFFLLIGRYVELVSRYRFQQSRDLLTRLLPADVTLVTRSAGGADGAGGPEQHHDIPYSAIRKDDLLRVIPGAVVPVDGIVVTGRSAVSEAAFTGEPMPVSKSPGSRVLAGAMNHDGELLVRADNTPEHFLIRQIARLYDQASQYRPRWSQLADRTARVFVAAVLVLAVGAGLFWYLQGSSDYAIIAMTVLVVACPCALSLATPVAYTVAVAAMRKHGVIIRNGAFLERAAETDTLVFDKTGTLTEASLNVSDVVPLTDMSGDQCLAVATAMERHSQHPIARAFNADTTIAVSSADVAPGNGVEAIIDGETWRIGKPAYVCQLFADQTGLRLPGGRADHGLWILLGNSTGPVAWFTLQDKSRPGIADIMNCLHAKGYQTAIYTGDPSRSRASIAQEFGARTVITAMSPDQKIDAVRELTTKGRRVMMIGDGINDAGAMAAADTSLAVSPRDVVVQNSADATVLGDALQVLPDILRFARKSRRIIRQNVGWSVTYNFTVIPFALAGMVPPWLAALGMSLSSVLVIANASRLGRLGRDGSRGSDSRAGGDATAGKDERAGTRLATQTAEA